MITQRTLSLRNLMIAAPFLLFGCWLIALAVGPGETGPMELFDSLLGRADARATEVLWQVRLPRIWLASLAGAALALGGATFQAVLRNPLADPYILGVSGGAALGAIGVSALTGGAVWAGGFARPLAAFVGALCSVAILFGFHRTLRRRSTVTLLLVGVVLNAISGAGILLLLHAASPGRFYSELGFLIGTIDSRALPWLVLLTLIVGVGALALLLMAQQLNLLTLGEEAARSLGVPTERTTWIAILAASWITAAAVAFCGLIGFVGLIVPHALRLIVGADHRKLLPASLIVGAAFLPLADAAARTMLAPTELPVGIVTTLLGGPAFLYLLMRHLRRSPTLP